MNKKDRIKLADRILVTVILFGAIITITVLFSYLWVKQPIPATISNSLNGFWGGELLIMALRQIFGSDAFNSKKKKQDSNLGAPDDTDSI